MALYNFGCHFFLPWLQDQLALRCVLTAVDKQQRLPVQGSPHVLPWPLLVLEQLQDVHPGALHRGLAVAVLGGSVLGPRVWVTRVTLRTAVSWTLLGVTQGTLTVAMRVLGVVQPFLDSLGIC